MWLSREGGGGVYFWEFLVGVCRPVLQILTLFQIKKCHFPHPFSDMEVVTKRNITRLHKTEINVIIAEIKTATKRFLEIHFEFEYYTSFSFIWNWNDEHIDIQPWFLRKPYPIPDQNGQNLYPFSDQNCAKALSSGAAHTYMAYIRDYPPPPAPHPARVTLHFRDRWGATSLGFKHLAEITFLMCEPKPYPVWFSCRR